MRLLAERGGVPIHEVTKRGGDSWMVTKMINEQHPAADDSEEKSAC
jgi:hypothetical protein